MAQIISTLCDWHLAKKDEEVPGTPRNIPLDVRKPRIDLCDDCFGEQIEVHVTALAALASELGRKEDESVPPINPSGRRLSTSPKIVCPEEGCGYTVTSRTSFRTHMPDVHNVSLPVWEGRNGTSIGGEKIEYFCDESDCEAGFTTPQGKGAHMASEHGYTAPDTTKRPRQQEQLPTTPSTPAPAKSTARRTAKKV